MHKIMDAYRFMRALQAGHNRTLDPLPPAHTTFLDPDAKTSWRTGLYIVDDDDLSHLPDYPETLIDVAEPLATVLPPASTKAHSRGRLVDPRTWRAVSFASTLEYCAGQVLASMKKITYFQEQPDALPYRWDGVDHTHRPDFKVRLNRSNRFVYIDVRPSWLLGDLRTQVALINNGVLCDTGDENIILTEHELPWAVRWNAKSMLRALRAYNRRDCDRLADRLFDLPDEIQITSLIEGLPNATAWNAVWCLIFEEILKPVSPKSMLIDAPKVRVNRGMLRELYP
ncbi:hypothetical protein [Rhizobium sp. BR 315]|uniref:hypothetical protein n=1 Tax=Rhizobium sp. BR 315 TaxID=3040014 RepID=UPI003D3538A9